MEGCGDVERNYLYLLLKGFELGSARKGLAEGSAACCC